MRIAKHCQENKENEIIGVIMGTTIDKTCYIGNSFPHYSRKIVSKSKKKAKTVVGKATEYFSGINYDNILCGVYINILAGKLYTSEFVKELFDTAKSDLINDAKICIGYDQQQADLGLNPFIAFRLNKKFVKSVKSKKNKEILSNRTIFDLLPLKLFRSSPDQVFLAEYICPSLSKYSELGDSVLSVSNLCCSFMKTVNEQFEIQTEKVKKHEYNMRKIQKTSKTSNMIKDIPDIEKLEFLNTVDELTDKIDKIVGTHKDKLEN